MKTSTNRPNIEELDLMHAAAVANLATLQRVPSPYREAVAFMYAYPELSAYVKALEAESRAMKEQLDDLSTIEDEFYKMTEVAKRANARINDLEQQRNERECGDYLDEEEY